MPDAGPGRLHVSRAKLTSTNVSALYRAGASVRHGDHAVARVIVKAGGIMTQEPDSEAISYQAAVRHSPVLASTGVTIGHLEHVLEVPELDVFDGIVISTHHGLRFIAADHVTRITRTELVTDLDEVQAAELPAPSGPPVYHVDALANSGSSMHDVLGRFFGRPHWTRDHD